MSEEGVRLGWSAPGFDPESDARLSGDGYVSIVRLDGGRTWLELHGERPEALLEWALQRAEGRILTGAWESNEPVAGAVQAAGFRLVRHSFRMAIELAGDLEAPVLPAGLELRSLRPGEERRVYETQLETFDDTWEPFHEPYEEWRHFMIERPDFDPTLWLVAVDADEIAGIALNGIQVHQPDTGRIMIVGVRRPWRRQGLGEALLRASFAALAARGCTRAILGVDAESLTGAHRLYERAGMHVAARYDIYERA